VNSPEFLKTLIITLSITLYSYDNHSRFPKSSLHFIGDARIKLFIYIRHYIHIILYCFAIVIDFNCLILVAFQMFSIMSKSRVSVAFRLIANCKKLHSTDSTLPCSTKIVHKTKIVQDSTGLYSRCVTFDVKSEMSSQVVL